MFGPAFVFDNVANSTLAWSAVGGVVLVTAVRVALLGGVVYAIGTATRADAQTLSAIAMAPFSTTPEITESPWQNSPSQPGWARKTAPQSKPSSYSAKTFSTSSSECTSPPDTSPAKPAFKA